MSQNPLSAKIAQPYARALFDFSVEKNIMHQITADFQNLETFFTETPNLQDYLKNPLISQEAKKDILDKTLKAEVNSETFKFLLVLVNRNRISIIQSIIDQYLKLVYEKALVRKIEVCTAFAFTNTQKAELIERLKELTKANEILLVIDIDPSLIGGFLIKTQSKIIDFTVKNQLTRLAKHLDSALEI